MKATLVLIVALVAVFYASQAAAEARVRMEEVHISGEIRPAPTTAPAGWKQLHRLEVTAFLEWDFFFFYSSPSIPSPVIVIIFFLCLSLFRI